MTFGARVLTKKKRFAHKCLAYVKTLNTCMAHHTRASAMSLVPSVAALNPKMVRKRKEKSGRRLGLTGEGC